MKFDLFALGLVGDYFDYKMKGAMQQATTLYRPRGSKRYEKNGKKQRHKTNEDTRDLLC